MIVALVGAQAVQFSPTSSGYLKVDENANMFHVFFEAREAESSDSPIVLWLQGGPGCSSMFGMLYINGKVLKSKIFVITSCLTLPA